MMAKLATTSENEWYSQWQRMATSGNERQRVVLRMTTSGTTSENEWQKRVTSDNSDNEWQRMTLSGTTNKNQWEQVK